MFLPDDVVLSGCVKIYVEPLSPPVSVKPTSPHIGVEPNILCKFMGEYDEGVPVFRFD